MGAGIIGSLLGVGSNLISTALNQRNYAEGMEFSRRQFEDMKARQDPVYQVERLRAAGISPALAYGNVNLGQATGTSQPSPTPVQPLDLSGLSSMANSIDLNGAQVRNLNQDTELKGNDAAGKAIDNLFRAEDWKSKIYGRNVQSWLNDQLSEAAKLDVEYNKNTLKFRVEQQRQQMALLQSQVAAQDLANHYFPIEASERISNLLAQQFANYATGRASLWQAHNMMLQIFAQFGKNEKERSQFFEATLEGLKQQKYESMGREWNTVQSTSPLPKNKGNWNAYLKFRKGDDSYRTPYMGVPSW